jgi:hypothetical protein
MEEAMKESVVMATKGRRYVDHVKTRLDFGSKDSESGSSKAAPGAAPGGWQTAEEELGEVFEEEEESEDEAEEAHDIASGDLLDFMRGFGHMQANDSGWPVFDGRYASYPQFRKEWRAYRETYHSAVNNGLAARALRDKCLKEDALQMVSHLDDLQEMWETLDTCYERPEKYMEEALRPIVDFRRYKVTDSAAVREFYSLLRAAVKGARGIGRLNLLINDQTIPRIMGKMPYSDWKEWATKRPDWMQQDVATTFERFVERKWQDALYVAAAEPASWTMGRERCSPSGGALDRAAPTSEGTLKVTGAVNVVEQRVHSRPHSPSWDVSFGRKSRARNLIGCDGDHVLLQCDKLLSMELSERKEVLEKSGLCLFCLKHAAELECYGRGGLSKPRCAQAGCNGEHTPGVHKLMAEESVGVNLVAEDDSELEEDEDEEWWVGTVGVVEMRSGEGRTLEELNETEPEEGTQSITSICVQGDDFGLVDKLECPSVTHSPGGDRWQSPEPAQPRFEEDEEEVQCRVQMLDLGPQGVGPVPEGAITGSRGDGAASGKPWNKGPPCSRGAKRKRPRERTEKSRDQEWEQVRQDAWLREMLSDTSGSEDEEGCGRFAESGRWISELSRFRIIQRQPQEGSVPDKRRRILPEVVLVRRWVIGVWEFGGGGFGEGVGQGRSVYKQPETEVDGSCHS